MSRRSQGSLRALACSLFFTGMTLPLSADDAPAEDAAFGITVQLAEETESQNASTDEVQNVEGVASRLILQLAEEGAAESEVRVTETREAIPARVRFLQQLDPQADYLTLTPPAHAYWFYRGMQMPPMNAAPMQVLMLHHENSGQPVIVRMQPQLVGGEGGAASFVYTVTAEDGSEAEATASYEPGEYMIGVSLSAIDSEVLRKHLSIEEGVGLIVDEVFENSPAQTAGLEVGDILLKVGETTLTSPEALVESVQAYSADSGESLTLEVIQAGERKTLAVTPTTRQELLGYDVEVVSAQSESVWRTLALPGNQAGTFNQLMVAPPIAWAQAQPSDNGLAQSIQSLAEQVARLQEAIDRLESKLGEE